MSLARAWPLIVLALVAAPARADVVLPGSQHIGDGEDPALTPADPVTRAQMQSNPTHFLLSQAVTVTAVQLAGVNDLDNRLQVFIDDMTTPLAGTLSGSCDTGGTCTYTLAAPLALPAGVHAVWPDGGCTPGGFAIPCFGGENDFGFSGITLVAAQGSSSRSDHRRRHIGGATEGDDDYGGRWYPDAPEGASVAIPFTVDITRVLSEVRFYRLRDVAATPATYAKVRVDGVALGSLGADGNPFLLSTSMLLAPGLHTLTVTAGAAGLGLLDDISWDDIVLLLANNPATTPGAFNAVDVGAAAATGPITTRTAGAAFQVDAVAVSGGAQFTGYAGTVAIELLDAGNSVGIVAAGTNCDIGWTPVATLGTAAFAPADGGRKTVTLSWPGALANARLRLSDAALGVAGCSTDNFAIRPAGFASIAASHGGPATAGTAEALAGAGFTPATLPVHRAGRPFTIQATAVNALGAVTSGYAGSPVLGAAASVLGSHLGTASASGWSASAGVVRTDAATYNEAGAVTLQLTDTTFADVDADDTPAAQRRIGPASFDVGRFVPDHFNFVEVVPAQFAAACGSFTYAGQPFAFVSTPSAQVVAVAADDTTVTRNYDGVLYKLPATGALPDSTYAAAAGTLDLASFPSPNNSFVNQGAGVSLYRVVPRSGGYAFLRGAPAAPFDADIGIALNLVDDDGVTFAAGAAEGFGRAAVDQGIPFAGSGPNPKQVRFGRLAIDNAHGTEKLPLDVPLRAEYWGSVAGSAGFVRNLDDGCTALAPADFALAPAGLTSITAVSGLNTPSAHLTLAAPGAPGQVTLAAQLGASRPWLLSDANGDGAYAEPPAAIATFGVFRNEERRVYQREVIGR